MIMSKKLKKWDVPFRGQVGYTVTVNAKDQEEALEKAYELRDEINEKSEIYVNDWWDDTCPEDVVETYEFMNIPLKMKEK